MQVYHIPRGNAHSQWFVDGGEWYITFWEYPTCYTEGKVLPPTSESLKGRNKYNKYGKIIS